MGRANIQINTQVNLFLKKAKGFPCWRGCWVAEELDLFRSPELEGKITGLEAFCDSSYLMKMFFKTIKISLAFTLCDT